MVKKTYKPQWLVNIFSVKTFAKHQEWHNHIRNIKSNFTRSF